MAEPLESLQELALIVGIVLIVASVGLSATWGEATALFKQPGPLVRSLIAMNVLAPVAACLMALAFRLRPAVQIALVAVAVSPVPPFLPKQSPGGHRSYAIGLLAATSLLAVAFVPLVLGVLEHVFVVPLAISSTQIASLVGVTVLLPLLLGIAVRTVVPTLAARLVRPASLLAGALLLVDTVVVLVRAAPGMWQLVGSGTLQAMVAYVVIALVIGNVLGGPSRATRAMLGMSTASRHPGVALAIATVNFPNEDLVLPAVLLLTAVGALLTWAYANWMARRTDTAAEVAGHDSVPERASTPGGHERDHHE